MTEEFYFNNMTAEQRAAYGKIASAVEEFRESVRFDSVTERDIRVAVQGYLFDHPGSYRCALKFCELQGSAESPKLRLRYHETDDGLFETEAEKILETIAQRLPENADDFEKCKAAYDCLIETVSELKDIPASGEHATDEFVGQYGLAFGVYGPIVQKRGTESGLALAYKYLLDRLDVRSFCVTATGDDLYRGILRTMNIAETDGRRAYVDLTRGFPAPQLRMIRYDSFLVPRSVIEAYCVLQEDWDCGEDVSYFARQGVVFYDIFALHSYLDGVSIPSVQGEIRFRYAGDRVGDGYLMRLLGNTIGDRCGNEYELEGYVVQNGVGNCRVVRI